MSSQADQRHRWDGSHPAFRHPEYVSIRLPSDCEILRLVVSILNFMNRDLLRRYVDGHKPTPH
jgi:hypothetical protein